MKLRLCALALFGLGSLLLLQASSQASQAGEKKRVSIKVHVPQNNAVLTIDGKKTKQSGALRTFTSPPLDVGNKYTYKLQVVWEPNNYTKITRKFEVKVDPAKDAEKGLEVDLRVADPRWKDDIVVRYVPTPDEVVDAMCKLGKVGKEDIVYDLGCGDGRMVIRAVKYFDAKKGIGVDIDPKLVKESKENAETNKVADKVEFREGDVLKIDDIPNATVVLLYMGNDINLRLRPILQSKLKPGARVVSHRFTMGDWEPTKTEMLTVDGEEYEIHLWVIGDEKKKKEKD
ncbi:MAG: TIGR03000 domain-containing protein [Gemmataceae bacterium]|nr:TIGR03000 domain-containing protein [Gemmataceae bacterium]